MTSCKDFKKRFINVKYIESDSSSNSVVCTAYDKETSKHVIMKIHRSVHKTDLKRENSLLIESAYYKHVFNYILEKKWSPNVVRFIDLFICDLKFIKGVIPKKPIEVLLENLDMDLKYELDNYTIVITELVKKSITLHKYIENIPFEKFINDPVFFQLFWILECFKRIGFVHNDLHFNNILLETHDNVQDIYYKINDNLYHVKSKYILKIFDLDFSYIVNTQYSEIKENITKHMKSSRSYKSRREYGYAYNTTTLPGSWLDMNGGYKDRIITNYDSNYDKNYAMRNIRNKYKKSIDPSISTYSTLVDLGVKYISNNKHTNKNIYELPFNIVELSIIEKNNIWENVFNDKSINAIYIDNKKRESIPLDKILKLNLESIIIESYTPLINILLTILLKQDKISNIEIRSTDKSFDSKMLNLIIKNKSVKNIKIPKSSKQYEFISYIMKIKQFFRNLTDKQFKILYESLKLSMNDNPDLIINEKDIGHLFPINPNIQYDKLRITRECMYSATLYKHSQLVLEIIKKLYKNIDKLVITDSTSCIGGSFMSLVQKVSKINAVELNNKHLTIMNNNMSILFPKLSKIINPINKNYLDVIYNLKSDIVLIDPPWGGVEYKESEKLKLYLKDNKGINIELVEIINKSLETCDIVIAKVPTNYDIDRFNMVKSKFKSEPINFYRKRRREYKTNYYMFVFSNIHDKDFKLELNTKKYATTIAHSNIKFKIA